MHRTWIAIGTAAAIGVACKPNPNHRPKYEEEWIVRDVLTALALLDGFRRPDTTAPEIVVRQKRPKPVFLVSGWDVPDGELTLVDHIWSPKSYVGLVDGSKSQPTVPLDPPDLLTPLLDPTIEVLDDINTKVSAQLSGHPRDPRLHVRAALLLGALSVREQAGRFSDTRWQLNRMAAHLTLSMALRGDGAPDVESQLANAMLSLLVGRTKEAVARLEGIPAGEGSAVASWVRALRMLATRDWRLLDDPTKASRLERAIYARQLTDKLSAPQAVRFISTLPNAAADIDLVRVMLHEKQLTVAACHLLSAASIDAEAQTISKRRKHEHRSEFPDSLNALPSAAGITDDGLKISVLDWGTLAFFAQRHLLADTAAMHRCFMVLGLPQEGARYVQASAELDSLRLYPFAAALMANVGPPFKHAAMASLPVLREQPEAVAQSIWARIESGGPNGLAGRIAGLPTHQSWHARTFPYGTALYCQNDRTWRNRAPSSASELRAFMALDPFDSRFRFALVKAMHGDPAPADALMELMGDLVEYDASLAYQIARSRIRTDPESARPWLKKTCEMDAEFCSSAAVLARKQGMNELAAEYYRIWFDNTVDRVRAANQIDWLVEYEMADGNFAEAQRIAKIAAQTYSAASLVMLGEVYERMKRYDAALEQFQKCDERYNTNYVLFFYRRRSEAGSRKYRKLYRKALAKFDLQRLGKLDRSKAPQFGMVITKMSPKAKAFGLSHAAVIVGLEDYLVRSQRDYFVVNDIYADRKEISLVVWTNNGYVELSGQVPDRRFGMQVTDYVP